MFGPDPIDLSDPSPYWALAYYGHLIIGTLALIAAFIALSVRKGSRLHRIAGFAFGGTTLLVCLTSIDMLAEVFIAPLTMAVFTALYGIGGAWLALRPGSPKVLGAEIGLSVFEIVGMIIFLSIAIPAARAGIIPPFAPLAIVIIPLIMLASDAHWFLRQAERKKRRIARHISRTIFSFIVVLRAPLVELAAAGLPLSPPLVIFGPLVLALAMLWYFRRRYVAKVSHA